MKKILLNMICFWNIFFYFDKYDLVIFFSKETFLQSEHLLLEIFPDFFYITVEVFEVCSCLDTYFIKIDTSWEVSFIFWN